MATFLNALITLLILVNTCNFTNVIPCTNDGECVLCSEYRAVSTIHCNNASKCHTIDKKCNAQESCNSNKIYHPSRSRLFYDYISWPCLRCFALQGVVSSLFCNGSKYIQSYAVIYSTNINSPVHQIVHWMPFILEFLFLLHCLRLTPDSQWKLN
eukprot:UN00654